MMMLLGGRELFGYITATVNETNKYYLKNGEVKSIHDNNISNTYGWTKYYCTFDVTDDLINDIKQNNACPLRIECTTACTSGTYIYWAAPKLEKGNKPTDWSPAPEDVDSAIDNIEVGGRNLILKTGTPQLARGNGEGTSATIFKTNDLYSFVKSTYADLNFELDDYVTLSYDWELTGTPSSSTTYPTQIRAEVSGTPYSYGTVVSSIGTNSSTTHIKNITANETSGHISTIYKINSEHASSTATKARFRIDNLLADYYITISNLKLEIGNKATDWTPAPEDYPTTVEMNSAITQKANEINLEVSKKVGNDEIISKINQSAEAVQINANKISLNGKAINLTSGNITISSDKFSVDKNGNITATGGNIGGFGLSSDTFETTLTISGNYTSTDVARMRQILLGQITPTTNDYEKYDFNNDKILDSSDLYWVSVFANNLDSKQRKYILDTSDATEAIRIFDETTNQTAINIGAFGSYINYLSVSSLNIDGGTNIKKDSMNLPTEVGNISIGTQSYNQESYSSIIVSNTNASHSVEITNDYIEFVAISGHPTLVYSGAVLYNNSSGSTGTITLTDNASNYDFLEIYYAEHNNGNVKQMVKVENPDGKAAQMQVLSQSGTDIRVNVQRATISGTTITKQYGQVNYMSGSKYTVNEIYIEKVVGYRSGYSS